MRYASWFLSILLHVTILTVLAQSIHLKSTDIKELMEVQLTEVEPPEELIQPMPEPPPPPPVEVKAPEPLPQEPPVAAAPLPMDKTMVLADKPPEMAPEPLPEPEPKAVEPQPEAVEISPVKVPEKKKEEEKPKRNRIDVRKGDIIVHRGHEARFGRSMMGDYFSYSSSEFSGQFTTRDDRTISIIDARNTKYGRFLIYDSKNKTLRRLKEFGKYVYTIGPSLYEDEPVVGVLTFLAKDDRIERFILTTDDDRFAHYPRKVHVRETEVTFPAPGGELSGLTSLPPSGNGHSGVVLVHGNRCVSPGLIQGFTRALSSRNLASLSFTVRGCLDEKGEPGTGESLVDDTRAALKFLAKQEPVKDGRIGLWGNGQGVPTAVEAASRGAVRPAFLVCLVDDTVDPASMPGKRELSSLTMPVLWLFTGRNTNAWRPYITTLELLRDKKKHPFTIVLAPLKAGKEVQAAKAELSGWVEQVAEDHSRLAVGWIHSLDK